MCCRAQCQTVTIYTDSHYAYGVVHNVGTLWHERGFITSSGTPIKNGYLIANLLQAILLLSVVAVIKCDAHTGGPDDVSKGNSKADEAAKAAAISLDALLVSQYIPTPSVHAPSQDDVAALQEAVNAREREVWVVSGCKYDNDSKLWISHDDRMLAPQILLPLLARLAHGASHMRKGGIAH